MVTQIFSLKTEKECFFAINIPVTKIIEKTTTWTIFCFWVSPPHYTNWAFMFLMQQSHAQWHVLWNLVCKAHNFVLLEKNLENKDFASPTLIFKLLVSGEKIVKTYISDVMGNCLPSKWCKTTNSKAKQEITRLWSNHDKLGYVPILMLKSSKLVFLLRKAVQNLLSHCLTKKSTTTD